MKRSATLLVAVCFCFLTLATLTPRGAAQVKYRNPLAGSPPFKAWMDHWHTPYVTNSNARYDDAFISSTSPYYYDPTYGRHRGTDFGVSTGTAVYAGAGGTVAYRSSGLHLHFELRYGLGSGDTSRDPFAGSLTQSTEYWNQYTLITDPLNPSHQIHYPTTACQ
jgi:murein DD-endopeptidase MepM/ murein hydrolase activator NlpD